MICLVIVRNSDTWQGFHVKVTVGFRTLLRRGLFLFLVFYFGFESWLFGVLGVCKTRSQFYISRTVYDDDDDARAFH